MWRCQTTPQRLLALAKFPPRRVQVLGLKKYGAWRETINAESLGDPITVFHRRDSRLENESRDLNSINIPNEIGRGDRKCQVSSSGALVNKKFENEKLCGADKKDLSLHILRDPTETKFTRDRSVLVVESTRTASFSRNTRKHKDSEFWPFSDAGKRNVEESAPTSSSVSRVI